MYLHPSGEVTDQQTVMKTQTLSRFPSLPVIFPKWLKYSFCTEAWLSAHGLVEHDGHTLSFLNLLWSCDRPGHCIALKPCYSCRWRTVLWLGSLRSSDLGCQIKRVPILEYLGMTNKPTKNRLPGTPRTIKMEGELCLGAFHLPSGRTLPHICTCWNLSY